MWNLGGNPYVLVLTINIIGARKGVEQKNIYIQTSN